MIVSAVSLHGHRQAWEWEERGSLQAVTPQALASGFSEVEAELLVQGSLRLALALSLN